MSIPQRLPLSSTSCPQVVVTGIGLVTPLGLDRESTWRGLLAGRSATRWLTAPHWTGKEPLAGALCASVAFAMNGDRDPVVSLALRTANEAIADAELDHGCLTGDRTGVVFGTSKGGQETASRLTQSMRQIGHWDNTTREGACWSDLWANSAARVVAGHIGCHGPSLCPVLACATGLAACQRAAELIREGVCDIVFAGSSDASLQPAILGSFRRLGVLADSSAADSANVCRPFDQNRSGFAIGEGAACLVFESLIHARKRHAHWYGEWLTGRMLTDPSGLTTLDPSAQSLCRLLRDVGRDVHYRPEYINLHGTATILNDRVESFAVRDHFGTEAGLISCSSLKGGLGHLLGAAGSVELAATLLAIRDQIAPPTVNLDNVDSEFDLDFTPREPRPKIIEQAWKLSLGFGGHLMAACLGRLRGEGDRTDSIHLPD